MLALCLADTHSNVSALRRLDALLRREAGRFSVVLAAGDITIAGHEAYAADFVKVVRRHGVPLLLVHGNNDTAEAVETFRREGVTIHRRERTLHGVRFVGFGGDGTQPHDFDVAGGESLELRLADSILLTHLPPPGVRYTVPNNADVAIAAASQPRRPAASHALFDAPRTQVCGHIHHHEGIAWLGPTKVIKLRAAMWNRCAMLDLKSLRVVFSDLGV